MQIVVKRSYLSIITVIRWNVNAFRPIEISVRTKLVPRLIAKRRVQRLEVKNCWRTKQRVFAQAAQAHASRKRGIYKLFMVLESGRDLRERPVLGYKRPLTIWDFVWGIKYRRFRTWNKTQFQHLFSEMNKAILPLASLCVLGAYSIVLGFICHDSRVTAAVNNLRLCMGNKISSISNVK